MRASKKTKARLQRYPDDAHPLAGVTCAADCFMSVLQWFNAALERDPK